MGWSVLGLINPFVAFAEQEEDQFGPGVAVWSGRPPYGSLSRFSCQGRRDSGGAGQSPVQELLSTGGHDAPTSWRPGRSGLTRFTGSFEMDLHGGNSVSLRRNSISLSETRMLFLVASEAGNWMLPSTRFDYLLVPPSGRFETACFSKPGASLAAGVYAGVELPNGIPIYDTQPEVRCMRRVSDQA